jgi:hypothetical protein
VAREGLREPTRAVIGEFKPPPRFLREKLAREDEENLTSRFHDRDENWTLPWDSGQVDTSL